MFGIINLFSKFLSISKFNFPPSRHDIKQLSNNKDYGHVIYAIGMTGDFRTRLNDTIESQICVFNKILTTINYQALPLSMRSI